MANSTIVYSHGDLPPLPTYQLKPLPPLISFIPDKLLILLLPIAAYWGLSMLFHLIDTMDYFPQYRLHTPAEVAKRNRVSRWEVVRDVVIQQIVQTLVGMLLGKFEPDDTFGKEKYDIAVWARRIRVAQRAVPWLLSLIGINVKGLADNLAESYPSIAGAILGGKYPVMSLASGISVETTKPIPSFAAWELWLAGAIFYYAVPTLQYCVGIVVVDTWQYFLHRAMHMNKWLYTKFHSRHHRLYVPYAYGALYNHPFEGFLLDTLGTTIAYMVAHMNTRQGMWFFSGLTLKTVDDHCGYSLPWDPLQHISGNNAPYHDVHHQSWGIKTNFSQPCSTIWDRVLGTMWTGGDMSVRYERSRILAQQKMDQDSARVTMGKSDMATGFIQDSIPHPKESYSTTGLQSILLGDEEITSPTGKAEQQAADSRQQVLDDKNDGGPDVLMDEAREEKEIRMMLKRSTRRRTTSSISGTDSFRGLRDRVTGSLHAGGGIIGMESSR